MDLFLDLAQWAFIFYLLSAMDNRRTAISALYLRDKRLQEEIRHVATTCSPSNRTSRDDDEHTSSVSRRTGPRYSPRWHRYMRTEPSNLRSE